MSNTAQRGSQDVERHETDEMPRSSSSVVSNDGDSSLVLRIKRKRGDEPISALRIETLLSKGFDPGKGGERGSKGSAVGENLDDDSSAGSSGRKRRLTDRGIFRLAETVSISSFTDAKATRQLEQRIKERRQDPSIVPRAAAPGGVPSEGAKAKDNIKSTSTQAKEESSSSASAASTSALRFKIVKPAGKTRSMVNSVSSLKSRDSSSSLRARALSGKHSRAPSKSSLATTKTHAKSSPLAGRVRFVDAVMERTNGDQKIVNEGKSSRKSPLQKKAADGNDDVEMNVLDRRFADLLGNYLMENDLEPPKDLYDSTAQKESRDSGSSSSSSVEDLSEDDYVYDIYYREKETNWGSGPAGAADAGLYPAEVAGREGSGSVPGLPPSSREVGPKASAEMQYIGEPMATLVGFNEGDDLISGMESATKLMAQEVPVDSDDDFDEGEDEDSNDEGFYRNDYPEDEGVDDDELEQSAWGWSGPRRRAQRSSSGDDDDNESGGDEEEESDYD